MLMYPKEKIKLERIISIYNLNSSKFKELIIIK